MGHRRSPAVLPVVVAVVAAAAGCTGTAPARYTAVPRMNGVRTAAGGRQLVVTYLGGGCDIAAKTHVSETATVVTVTAAIGTTGANCATLGIPRALSFVLPEPFGHRLFRNGPRGSEITVFDGSLLGTPAWLPTGYHQITDFQSAAPNGSWSRSWRGAATYTDPDLTLTIGPHPLRAPLGTPVPGRYRVGTATATLTRYTAGSRLSLQWTAPGTHTYRDLTTTTFTPSKAFSVATLLRVAASVPD